MLATYSKEKFKPLILAGIKIHTMREDKADRWKMDMKIQHWLHSPRNPSKNPHQFLENTCTGIEKVVIARCGTDGCRVQVNGKELSSHEISLLALNDGFEDEKDFRLWFVPPDKPVWKGKIIHWTEKRYGI